MLPSVVATELKDAIGQYLRAAFPIATPWFQRRPGSSEPDPQALIDELIQRPGALFKGPWLDIKMPFRLAETDTLPFRHLKLPFAPYRHQLKAFQRLCGDAPQSTIVATGTGSGKTECFMLPVLDDCLQRRTQGIKTLVIYPMNALATDQAKRFAREIAKLDKRLTVGLFVGGEGSNPETAMGPENVITCHKTLRRNPPDILLTNYKMLDYLLLRPRDQPLWKHNAPGLLRYLVVDELHSFDGAQGTDLACLIRRLRDRLQAGPELACVGTSATMGGDDPEQLLNYARQIFATDFGVESVIGEDRLSPQEYLQAHATAADEAERFGTWPTQDPVLLDPARYATAEDYLFHQARLWFSELPLMQVPRLDAADARVRAEAAVALGMLLHRHRAFHALILACANLSNMEDLAADWQQQLGLPERRHALLLLTSLSSLISTARLWRDKDSSDPTKWCQPLLSLRQQWWLRELRRVVCHIPLTAPEAETALPALRFADDKPEGLHLPLLHCRECHLACWGAVARKGDQHLNVELQDFYQAWFGNSPQARLLLPLLPEQTAPAELQRFCPACQHLQSGTGEECRSCGRTGLLRVWVPDISRMQQRNGENTLQCHHNCPDCDARDSMTVLGYRAATLSSVMAGRLFNTPYNDDYKLIAFSDSVQDAAHRAGFLGANTWRQLLRQALGYWLKQQKVPWSLQDMREALPHYWFNQVNHPARFCGMFIAPNMEWMRDYQSLRAEGSLPTGSELPEVVAKRLGWECQAEFGRRSRIGRSMERSGLASVGVDLAKLRSDLKPLLQQLQQELGSLRELSPEELLGFVLGWVLHLRSIGAIYDPALDSYLQRRGDEFLLNRLHWMPNFGRSQRPPAAITLRHVANNFEALTLANRSTWSQQWLKKALGGTSLFVAAETSEFFTLLLEHLTRSKWLLEKDAGGEKLWLLNPARLLVEGRCTSVRCSHCRHQWPVHPEQVAVFSGLPCLRPSCQGTLAAQGNTERAHDYGQTLPRRLVPHEHTGLLERDERERVEQSFIKGREPWDINLLSATPTLEMGIDIGELSTVLLCSVPPAQANYLQRIGRAGRRDGNALAITVANGQKHDLHFYADPPEMMVGSVQTPGVFLKALAVLERQLIAYCFDRWVLTGIDESAIPGELRRVLDAVESNAQDQFPYTLIHFVSHERPTLLRDFLAMFDHLDLEAREYLGRFISDEGEGSLSWRLVNRLQQLVEERKVLQKKAQQLKLARERLLQQPQDEARENEIKELERERGAHLSLLTGMNKQHTLNFFTDEGLLPNYAFPEEGVTLRSVILRRRNTSEDEDGQGRYEKLSFSLQRSAQAALGELAPESVFYAVSHQMQIEQIDLQLSRPESWRFCNRCHHAEQVDAGDQHSACPRCGSAQWADSGQKHTVLKLRQVYSTVHDRYDRIGDEAEQREPLFFNRQMLVDIPADAHAGGFRLKSEELPFGFEFLRRANFREVNFGQAGGETRIFSVAGEERPRKGFRICRHCGKVQKARFRRHEKPHAYTCKLYQQPESATPEDFFESLYLYRELKSEAIRILLPLSEVAYSDVALHSFIAALNLGLRSYFRGNVQHLEITTMREPAEAGSGERIYLVLYDRIPGGTGYLKDLMRSPQEMMDMLQAALRHLQHCACNDDASLDGCYRCVLAYRNSHHRDDISRQEAIHLLEDILALRDQLEEVESLGSISTNVLIESKLEQRFVDALAALPGAQMSKALVNGKQGSLLTLKGSDGETVPWLVEHQVLVGPAQGACLHTEIDVLLTPARAEQASRYRPIAVYLDGLQYHHNIVADDVAKRSGLLRSGRYWVYSFNWDDLPDPGSKAKPQTLNVMALPGKMQSALQPIFEKLAMQGASLTAQQHAALNSEGGIKLLALLLRNPALSVEQFPARALFRAFTSLLPDAKLSAELRPQLEQELGQCAAVTCRDLLAISDAQRVPGALSPATGSICGLLQLHASLPVTAMKQASLADLSRQILLHLGFDDSDTTPSEEFKASWRGFWHAVNQLQFLPGFAMATRKSAQDGLAEQVWSGWQPFAEPAPAPAVADEWIDVLNYSSLDPTILHALQALGLPEPEVGLDLCDESGAIVLSGDKVELCWTSHQVAVVTSEVAAALPGWRLLLSNDELLTRLGELKEQGVF